MHHRTIQINHQPDATIFQFIILMFIYSSTCVGRFPAHHQELNDCSGSLWFYLRIVVTVVLCSWSGQPKLLMMGGKTPKTCWAVNKCQDNKLENCCIWLVIYLNSSKQVITPDFTSHTFVEYPCNDITYILQYTAPYSYVLPNSHYPFQGHWQRHTYHF